MSKQFFLLLLASSILLAIFSMALSPAPEKNNPAQDLACTGENLTGIIDFSDTVAIFEGVQLDVPEVAFSQDDFTVLSLAYEEHWVEVDLSEQKLRAWEGDRLFLETPVSTGLPWWPTPEGEFRIWIKLRATKMEGGTGRNYYYLPNVPYVMYFENDKVPGWRGYGLHGTYWHNDFGRPKSHGCVNLPTPVAKELYYWTKPTLPESKSIVYSSQDNLGTRVVIHE